MSDTFEANAMLTILRYLPSLKVPSVANLRHIFRSRCDARQLLDLDDAALRDIGLMREDIARTLADPHILDPTGRLGQLARERRDFVYRKWRDHLADRK